MNDELLKKIKENDLTIEEWLKMRVTEEYEKALINKIDELQSNWNSLREWIKENEDKISYMEDVIDKMNELERKDKE